MPATSFGFSYDWPAIESSLDAISGFPGAPRIADTSPVTGEDESVPLASTGGLATAVISESWQAIINTVSTMLVVRDRELIDYLGAWLSVSPLVGTLDGTGTAAVAHGVNGAPTRVISVAAWFAAADGSAQPLTVTSVDGTNLNLSGGTAGASFHATMIFGVGR